MSVLRNVLMVDDERILREFVSEVLGSEYNVIEAKNYDTGLEKYLNNKIDLVILDIDYREELTGIDLLNQIKQNNSSIPVIMLSDLMETENIVESIKHGAYDYISKNHETIDEELPLRVQSALLRNLKERNYEYLKSEKRITIQLSRSALKYC
ncbi:MAG: response regulator [Pseudomonadota bacterium]